MSIIIDVNWYHTVALFPSVWSLPTTPTIVSISRVRAARAGFVWLRLPFILTSIYINPLMATSVELDMHVTRSKRDHNAEPAINHKTDVLSETDEARDRRREHYSRFPPVSQVVPSNTAQHQRHTTKTSEALPRRTVSNDEVVQYDAAKTASSSNSCVRYELPARPPIHRLNAANEVQGSFHRSQRSEENYTAKYAVSASRHKHFIETVSHRRLSELFTESN